ncbi:BadF/BadG/BcrA/BcrD ATPase family protein [Sulfitobacter faviae]|uniref:BadF/BadG/BcrA/BcrD ATPase family protein n=1 Tax=Sulfitobacter faviae TaxID=1775881 RepID=A0ABZ0V0L7_9RHOB|nr:BadF/BadG/BcrA/BcrD ATPase family protein [Sulfitobacter faviae]WPZ22021.1 BadF/BadG/BcrA/BcrD ATPase family protein [Sulfitobacter faviae]
MSISAPLLIAVDGGGTGCRAAIGTQRGGILGRASGGRANIGNDPDQTLINIRTTVEAAAASAGLPAEALAGATAFLGLAGMNVARDAARLRAALPYARVIAEDDRPACVVGALGEGAAGWVLAIGTGTIVAATDGAAFRYVGSWGFHLADQGSGAWLGRGALDLALQCYDGVLPHSDLTRALLADFADDPEAFVAFSLTAQPGDYAAFAPKVIAAAEAGDHHAQALMRVGAAYYTRALKALDFAPGDPLCLLGGVGPHYAPYLPEDHLAGRIAARGTALDGAFHLACKAAAEEVL